MRAVRVCAVLRNAERNGRRRPHLNANEIYAFTGHYILAQDGVVALEVPLDARTLPQTTMPNRDGFFSSDEKPDT